MSNGNESNVRKIINPKSGFILYLREFSDNEISQVSTQASFPLPVPGFEQNNSSPGILNEQLINQLKEIKTQNKKLIESNNSTVKNLLKRNQQLTYIAYILIFTIGISVFF